MEGYDYISATDRPALLAVSTPDYLSQTRESLTNMGFKCNSVINHSEFITHFSQVQYHVIVVEDTFGGAFPEQNPTIEFLKEQPMSHRRHSVVLLMGQDYKTMNPLQSFQHSVHGVINYGELMLLDQLVQKAIADNELFYSTFQELTRRVGALRNK